MEHSTNSAPASGASGTTPGAVTQRLALDLIDSTGTASPIEAELTYEPADPYAVTALFLTGAGNVRWTFGRDLLVHGLYEPTGDGDVHVWPCLDTDGHAVVIVELCSPDGEALVQVRTGELKSFVERMTALVPAGTEGDHLDVDAAIHAILAAA